MQNTIDPLKDGMSKLKLFHFGGDEETICKTIRVCYDKDYNEYSREKDSELLRHIISSGHTSTLEQANHITFEIKCPITVARQIVRHRVGTSWTEKSGRYTKFNNEIYIPEGLTEFQEAKYREAIGLSDVVYRMLLNDGLSKEQARGVLPLSTYTHFYWTCNLRSFLHFQELRNNPKAQKETRLFAKGMLDLLEKSTAFPTICGIIKEKVGEK